MLLWAVVAFGVALLLLWAVVTFGVALLLLGAVVTTLTAFALITVFSIATLVALVSVSTLAVSATIATFLLFLLVEASDAVLPDDVAKLLQLSLVLFLVDFELVGFHAVLVEGDNLKHALSRNSNQIGWYRLVGRICHFALEDVGLEVEIGVVLGFESGITRRQLLCCFGISIDLEVEAALQLSALSGELLRIERDILESGCACGNRNEVRHPA